MSHLILEEDQIRILTAAKGGAVEVQTPDGKSLGYVEFTSEADIIAECKRRRDAKEPTFTTQKVKEHLHALEEAANNAAGEEELWDLLKDLQKR